MAPAKMNVVPSVEFVPRIIISPSVGAPINDPIATIPIATTSAILTPPIITDKDNVTLSFLIFDSPSFPYLYQHL